MTDGSLTKRIRIESAKTAKRVGFVVPALVIIADQLTKTWAVRTLTDGRKIHLVWTLQFNLTHNSGMAFSQGAGFGPIIGALAVVVVALLVASLRRADSTIVLVATGLIIGGALGNVADRLFRGVGWFQGAVVDFIDLQWWPVFNVADMCVMIGAATMIFGVWRAQRVTQQVASE